MKLGTLFLVGTEIREEWGFILQPLTDRSHGGCLWQIGVIALAVLHSEMYCVRSSAFLCSQTTSMNLLRRFLVVDVSPLLKLQLAELCRFEISLYSSSGIGAAPFRSDLSSTVY